MGPMRIAVTCAVVMLAGSGARAQLPPDTTYRPLPTAPLEAVIKSDSAAKPKVMQRQQSLLDQRYDLSDRPVPNVMMSGGRKAVQGGVRVKLPAGVSWDQL